MSTEESMRRHSVWTWFLRAALLLFIGGIALYVYSEPVDPMVLVTLLLVLANAISLYQNHEAHRVERRSRRRPYVKKVIVSGIDAMLEWIEKNKRWEERTRRIWQRKPYPSFPKERIPREFFVDIFRSSPHTETPIEYFHENYELYQSSRRELKIELGEFIESEFRPDDLPTEIQQVIPTYDETPKIDRIEPTASPAELLETFPDTFAEYILTDDVTTPYLQNGHLDKHDCCEYLFDAFRDEFLDLRENEFNEEFEQLDNLHDQLQESQMELETTLRNVRDGYITEYQIMEAELRDVENESQSVV